MCHVVTIYQVSANASVGQVRHMLTPVGSHLQTRGGTFNAVKGVTEM